MDTMLRVQQAAIPPCWSLLVSCTVRDDAGIRAGRCMHVSESMGRDKKDTIAGHTAGRPGVRPRESMQAKPDDVDRLHGECCVLHFGAEPRSGSSIASLSFAEPPFF